MGKKKKTAYVVFRGRKPGVYLIWDGPDGCEAQTKGFKGVSYQGYSNLWDANRAWENHLQSQELESRTQEIAQNLDIASQVPQGLEGKTLSDY
jgi:viroplasmin and RNaseH domain-containing protein